MTAAPIEPPYRWAALASVAVLVLYLVTLAPTTAMWDASEYIAAARVLGLPHPPGNPLFVMLAHAFALLPIPVSYAARINILAALCTAFASGVWFLLIDHVLARGGMMVRNRRIVAAAGVLIGATAFTVWNQSVVNEKVYTVSLAIFGAITWLMVLWLQGRGQRRNDARLVAVSFLLGAGYAVHPAGLLPGLAVVVTVVAFDWRKFLNGKLVLAVLGAFVLGLTPFIYEPIRAAQFPAINEGAPTGCATHLELSCTFSHLTYQRLSANINREQYGKPAVTDRQISFPAQVGMLWLYFKWQWLRDPHGAAPALQLLLALGVLALGAYGAVVHWRWDRRSFWYWATFMLTLTLLLVYYMNFKYGYSQALELGDAVPREVRDRDYFYLWSFSAWSVWVAIGIAGLWARSRYAAALVALGLIPLVGNWQAASRRGDTVARDWAVDLLNSTEPYGVILTNCDNDTFPLWYAQEVEGVRRDVTVVIGEYLGTDWFVRQLIRTPVVLYDREHGPALYRGKSWPVPTHPVFRLTTAQADAIPDYMELSSAQLFRSGAIEGRLAPGYITRPEILVLRLLTDALPERPIYFSPGSPYVQRLGLGHYIIRQGLLEHMSPTPIGDSTGAALDIPRSLALWNSYLGPAAIIRRGDWVDRASLVTPIDYALLGLNLSGALAQQGNNGQARPVQETTVKVIRAARMGDLFGLPAPTP
ncbi:MAG: glycosyltransferase family 117 protein [Gemmatimonadaceae bacterium]